MASSVLPREYCLTSACVSESILLYVSGNLLCAVYVDKHSLSLRAQCRGTLRLQGYEDKVISKLRLPSPITLFLNYNVLYPGYVKKLIPIRTISDLNITTGQASYDDVMAFIKTHATEEFCVGIQVDRNAYTAKQDLVMLMHKLYNEECFNEITYEEPPLRKPRYSMEQVPEERMRLLGLYRPAAEKGNTTATNTNKRSIIPYVLK